MCFTFKAITEPNLNGVFWHFFFFLQLLWLHHISGKAACWESSESSVQKLVLLFTIHQLGIFSSRTLVPSLPFHLFQKLNKELLPREESPQAPKMKMVPRRVLMVKPSLLQTELWNAIWKLSLSLRQQDFVSWKGIPFSLWKLVIDGSKFTQVFIQRNPCSQCIFHIQPGVAMGKQSQETLKCLADSHYSVEEFILNKCW